MSDIWGLSTGENAADKTDGNVEDNFGKTIPHMTMALAVITDAEWATGKTSGVEYVKATWEVMKPESLSGRKVWQMLHINTEKKEFRDSQRRKFAAIDYNAGGKLAKKGGKPSDDDLALHLTMKPMVIEVKEVWDKERGEYRNEIGGIYTKSTPVSIGKHKAEPSARAGSSQKAANAAYDTDEDLPF